MKLTDTIYEFIRANPDVSATEAFDTLGDLTGRSKLQNFIRVYEAAHRRYRLSKKASK